VGAGYVAVWLASLLVPLYALSLGASAFDVGALAATAAFAGVPGALWWGWLAERADRRRVVGLLPRCVRHRGTRGRGERPPRVLVRVELPRIADSDIPE